VSADRSTPGAALGAEEIAGLLAEHCYQGTDPYRGMGEGVGPLIGYCTCGWWFEVADDGADEISTWAAHVADLLSSHVRRALVKAVHWLLADHRAVSA
jgi:hypothetical protein